MIYIFLTIKFQSSNYDIMSFKKFYYSSDKMLYYYKFDISINNSFAILFDFYETSYINIILNYLNNY